MLQLWRLLAITVLLGLVLTGAAPAATDVYAYNTDDNSWALRQESASVDAAGFVAVQSPFAGGSADYGSRTLLFAGHKTRSRVYLIYADDMLAGFCFDISSGERSYKELRSYYKERYGSLQTFDTTASSVTWMDEDGDTLTVEKAKRADGSASTLVMYLSDVLYSHIDGKEIPAWMKACIEDL